MSRSTIHLFCLLKVFRGRLGHVLFRALCVRVVVCVRAWCQRVCASMMSMHCVWTWLSNASSQNHHVNNESYYILMHCKITNERLNSNMWVNLHPKVFPNIHRSTTETKKLYGFSCVLCLCVYVWVKRVSMCYFSFCVLFPCQQLRFRISGRISLSRSLWTHTLLQRVLRWKDPRSWPPNV